MQSKYVYVPLGSPDSEIRILELLPGSDSMIQTRIHTSSLSALPAYSPISYTWGSQKNLVEIFINGKIFLITRNLVAALKQLRQSMVSLFIWVDAVCINQEDALEKSLQIPLMAEIYRQGQRTIVWLGEHDHSTARAFDMVETMARYVDTTPEEQLVELYPDNWRLLQKQLKRKESESAEIIKVKPVLYSPAYWISKLHSGRARTALFGRAWFTRVWVIQEISMSARALVMCGRYSIDWERIEKAYSVSKQWNQWKDGYYLGILIQMRASIAAREKKDLGVIIREAAFFAATVPVDRIYAVLGLAQAPPPGFEIPINYTTDPATKFTETTRMCLTLTRDMRLVLRAGCRYQSLDSSLPSWVWSLQVDPEQPMFRREFHAAEEKCHFSAGGCEKASEATELTFSDNHLTLFLHGFAFEEIIAVGPVFNNTNLGYTVRITPTNFSIGDTRWPRRFFSHLLLSKRVANPLGSEKYPGIKETRRQAWISFLTGLLMMDPELTDEVKTRESLRKEEAAAQPYHILGRGPDEMPWSKRTPLRDPEMPRMKGGRVQLNPLMNTLPAFLAKRRVVRTSKGYVGLCDQDTQVGDHVALVQNLCVPIILRPGSDNAWKLVGEAFFHGIMHGELWSGAKAGTLSIM
ncbi:heterokaryon incompatibility protein-domain-containing protein [Coniella lustricola]|uniref:Heterokaryon incompatibility protein-domain-containing protein n=1 Tax=Coniella lustricola TaxID=2025994 RepID=A0A2T3A4N4_9PEZI|nr:heterokaryon incompatibility protein-domain-containing protein [Coniella lustricola]